MTKIGVISGKGGTGKTTCIETIEEHLKLGSCSSDQTVLPEGNTKQYLAEEERNSEYCGLSSCLLIL